MGTSQSKGSRRSGGKQEMSRTPVGYKMRTTGPGYFILTLKDGKIKIVNIGATELKIITTIIKRHCKVSKEGWDRNMTYSFKLEKPEKNCLIQLVTDILLSLFKEGWEPMTPIDTAGKTENKSNAPQTSICFRRREETENRLTGSSYSLASVSTRDTVTLSNECLCIDTFQPNFISFHSVPNTVLHEIVTRLQQEWPLGVKGVSVGVASVISDYTTNMPPTLNMTKDQTQKIIQLHGCPWSQDTDTDKQMENGEKINTSIIAVLANAGFKLSMPINLPNDSHVYFFIHDPEETSDQMKIPRFSRAAPGSKDISAHEPMMTKSKPSFYKNCSGRSNSVKNKIRASLRRKTMLRAGRNHTMIESESETTAWWQQKSIDMGDGELGVGA